MTASLSSGHPPASPSAGLHGNASGSRWPRIAVLAGFAATAIGIVVHGLWRELPAERFALSLALAVVALLVAWLPQRLLRWSWATAIASLWLVALAFYVGPLPIIAAAVFASAAAAIGLGLAPASFPARFAIAATLGLVIVAGITGWLVTLPAHHVAIWWSVLLALIAWRRTSLLAALRDAAHAWRTVTTAHPRASAAVVMLLGLASTACWLPSMQADDLSYHLGLPSQWLAHARYAPNADHQMWSYAAWAGDIVHAIVGVMSGRIAHGAMNAVWLLLGAGAIWSLTTSLGAASRERWASLALYAAFPPLIWMTAGMQTELAGTVLLLALAALIVGDAKPRVLPVAILFAGLFAWKLTHGMAAAPLLVYALWRHRAQPAAVSQWILAFVVFAALAGSSYVLSWHHTGNPVLPAFNNVFGSAFAPLTDARDPRWFAGFAPDIVWQVVFDTDRYVEGWDGGLGFTLIALAGAWLLLLLRPGLRLLALTASVVALLPLVPMQYARYAWPGIVLLSALLPIGLEAKIGRRFFAIAIIALCVSNLAYQANASWLHHSAAFKRTLRGGPHDAKVVETYLPELLLMHNIPANAADIVLDAHPQRNVVAMLAGRGRTMSHHDPSLQTEANAANGDNTGQAWHALLQRERIRWVLVQQDIATPALRAGLARAGATRTNTLRNTELWRLPDVPSPNNSASSP